ncbi:Hint domain-containing protein, partial [Acetobacter orleanensis]|uniref:Hint domain-containing protein n=2 Tax=Acetobacter orleanensis TaxID=104099 RepID=UPI001580F3FC
GNSILWQNGKNWNQFGTGSTPYTYFQQITFPAGTTVTDLGQKLTLNVWVNNVQTTMTVTYSGHFKPTYPLGLGDAMGFTVTSLNVPTGSPPVLNTLVGKEFVVTTGQASTITGGTLIPEVPNDDITCFLAGARVEMADGSFKAIEDMTVGEHIKTFAQDGTSSAAPVTAVRTRTVVATQRDLFPIVIQKDAFAEGVPAQQIALTAEHCLYLNGRFVPVRMLVNGRSIFVDTTNHTFPIYHVETAEHAIINVDGLRSETLLRTDKSFSQEENVLFLRGPKSWEQDAAAPLTTDPAFVEPLFAALAARAEQAGLPSMVTPQDTTQDSDLHLVTDTGRIIRQARTHHDSVLFMVPGNVRTVRLVSRTSRPCDTVGPFIDDRRNLGVLVGNIRLIESLGTRALTSHLKQTHLAGWAVQDNPECRWTTGQAVLD